MKEKIITVRNLLFTFVIYAIIGWVFEELIFLVEDRIFVNRGVLFGPWLPIYGFGGLIIVKLLKKIKEKERYIKNINIRPLLLIIYITIVSATVELISTYVISFTGGDFKTLWDYSEHLLNFQGRIALWPAIRFGLLGTTILYLGEPKLDEFKNSKNEKTKWIVMLATILLFILDIILRIFFGCNYNGPV